MLENLLELFLKVNSDQCHFFFFLFEIIKSNLIIKKVQETILDSDLPHPTYKISKHISIYLYIYILRPIHTHRKGTLYSK